MLPADGIKAGEIPAKVEDVAFGPDVRMGGAKVHTLWIANDNDFLTTVPDASGNRVPLSNQFFVYGCCPRARRTSGLDRVTM